MMRAMCVLALTMAVSGLTMQEKGKQEKQAKKDPVVEAKEDSVVQAKEDPVVQFVTFATPYRLTSNFARVQPDSLVSSIKSDFQDKGFEPIINLGHGKVWTANYQEKITHLQTYLENHENQNKIVAFVDGEDVILGGCDKSELLERYNGIVKKSGAKIVFGAELWCFEPPTQTGKLPGYGQCPEPPRARWAKKAYGDHDLDKKLREWQDERSSADNTTSLINLNSGFFMGPAADLLQMMKYSSDPKMWFHLHNGTDYYGDQRMYAQYWFENPDKVTLDYGAELVLTAHGFKKEALKMDDSGNVHNTIFDRKQCIVHGSGFAKAKVGDLQMERARALKDKSAELALKARCLAMPESCSSGEKNCEQTEGVQVIIVQELPQENFMPRRSMLMMY